MDGGRWQARIQGSANWGGEQRKGGEGGGGGGGGERERGRGEVGGGRGEGGGGEEGGGDIRFQPECIPDAVLRMRAGTLSAAAWAQGGREGGRGEAGTRGC